MQTVSCARELDHTRLTPQQSCGIALAFECPTGFIPTPCQWVTDILWMALPWMTAFQTFLKFWAVPNVERSSVEATRLWQPAADPLCFLLQRRMHFVNTCPLNVTPGSCRVHLPAPLLSRHMLSPSVTTLNKIRGRRQHAGALTQGCVQARERRAAGFSVPTVTGAGEACVR